MEPIDWLVDKILPVGLSILGAPSKYYKSYMALGLCVAICQGAKFLGFDCTKHDCLYFDLESTKRRPKNRLDQIVGTGTKKPDNLHIITGDQSPGRIGEGFEEQVEYQLQKYPNIKLIVIDVFQLIRQPAKRNQTGYDRDYEDFRALKQIVDKHDIGVLLIHHTRKMKDPSDVFNELSGSTGMLGAQDCAWLISKKDRSDNEATLHITGRDLDNRDLKIEFDKKFFQWRYIGTEEEVEARRRETAYMQSPIRETIIKLVGQGSGHWEGRSEEIKNASKYLSQEIYEDVRNIGKFIREYSDLLQGIDGVNAIPGNTKTRKWKFNDTNATSENDIVYKENRFKPLDETGKLIESLGKILKTENMDINPSQKFGKMMYKLYQKYSFTPADIQSQIDSLKDIKEDFVNNIFKRLNLNILNKKKAKMDLDIFLEKFISINGDREKVFKEDREAYLIKISSDDIMQMTRIDTASTGNRPLQCSETFFDGKKSILNTKECKNLHLCYNRKRGYLGCFTVQFSVTKGWGVIKTYYVPEEDDIQNVLQTVFENY